MTRVLFVCTANRARSAFADALLRNLSANFDVISAGTQAAAGHPADTNSLAVASQLGIDLSTHSSSRLDSARVKASDLVLCMTNEHLRHAVGLHTKSWPYTFTVNDFARRASKLGPRSGGDFARYIAGVHEGRSLNDAWIDGGDADIPDPIERSKAGHLQIFREISERITMIELLLR